MPPAEREQCLARVDTAARELKKALLRGFLLDMKAKGRYEDFKKFEESGGATYAEVDTFAGALFAPGR